MLSDCFFPVVVSAKTAVPTSSSAKPLCKSTVNVIQGNGVIGSAYVEMENTKVICSVSGPALGSSSSAQPCDLESGVFQCDVRFATFLADNGMSGLIRDNQASVEKRLSEAMKDALESSILLHLYPKAIITIHAVILESSPSDIVSLINCGSLALMDASIEIKDIVSAYSVSCSVPVNCSTLSAAEFETLCTANPATGSATKKTQKEEHSTVAVNISAMCGLDLTTYVDQQGRIAPSVLMQFIHRGRAGCSVIREQLKETIRNKQMMAAK